MCCNYKAAITLLLTFFVGVDLSFGASPPATNYVEGEVIVAFKPSTGATVTASEVPGHRRLQFKHRFGTLSQKYGRQLGVVRGTNLTTADLLTELRQDPQVETAEPNYVRHVTGVVPSNDPFFLQQWGLQNTGQVVNGAGSSTGADIQFLSAWALARPTTNQVVVAVIDTGVDFNHPDLVSNMWTNPGEIPANGLDDDGNGFADDVHGWNFADGNSNPSDSGFHGTHVAGIVAASGNNLQGVIGVDFQAKIMDLRASSDGSTLADSAIISAIDYTILMKGRGVNIAAINASFAGGGFDSVMESAIQSAGNVGIVFCAAADNFTTDIDASPTYPASYHLTNMIVVAATDQNDGLASFSNFGAHTVDLAAPGVNILSTLPTALSGTEPATAAVEQGAVIYNANDISFAGLTNAFTATIYSCGLGNPGDFPGAVNGNIALIQRGTLTFSNKVFNAMAAGAKAAIIYNNTNGNFFGTIGSAGNWIPAVSISLEDGTALNTLLPTNGTVFNSGVYQLLNGTSMATPHVAGAVAFAAMNFPSETATQRVQRVITNVDLLPSLAGKVVSGGRLNLRRIVDTDGNALPDWWEQIYFNHLTGTDPAADPDNDGAPNLAEWLAGTVPTNSLSVFQLVSVTNNPANVSVTWNSVAGRNYFIQRTPQVPGGSFLTIATNLPGEAGTTTYLDPSIGTNATFYYRVGIEP